MPTAPPYLARPRAGVRPRCEPRLLSETLVRNLTDGRSSACQYGGIVSAALGMVPALPIGRDAMRDRVRRRVASAPAVSVAVAAVLSLLVLGGRDGGLAPEGG